MKIKLNVNLKVKIYRFPIAKIFFYLILLGAYADLLKAAA